MRRSWRFRQALAVLFGKCRLAIGCQFSPDARARNKISSSEELHIAAFLWLLEEVDGYGTVAAEWCPLVLLLSFGMIGSALNMGIYGNPSKE